MKRLTALLLVFSHLIAITGIQAKVHFCGNHITGIAISGQVADENCACALVKKQDCCDDIIVKSDVTPLAIRNFTTTQWKLGGSPIGAVLFEPIAPPVSITLNFIRVHIPPDQSDISRPRLMVWRV